MNKNSPPSKIRRGKKQDKHKIAQLKCSGKLIEGRFVIAFTVVPTTFCLLMPDFQLKFIKNVFI